jgi:carboxylesterase type B
MVECLRTKNETEVMDAIAVLRKPTLALLPVLFKPVVDVWGGDNSFMDRPPPQILREGRFNKVPLLGGINANEGGLFYIGIKNMMEIDDLTVPDMCVDYVMNFTFLTRQPATVLCDKVKAEYLPGVTLTDPDQMATVIQQVLSDAAINVCHQEFLTAVSELQAPPPVYMYLLSYRGQRSLSQVVSAPDVGVTHADDLLYLFDTDVFSFLATRNITGHDQVVSERMLAMWTTFAKTGNPTPGVTYMVPVKWRGLEPGRIQYLNISDQLQMEEGAYRGDKVKFWSQLLPEIQKGRSARILQTSPN